ncbi:MAG: peptide ABC transporter ATP-binding protein [Spirochaetes bacterium]|nr:MAG: peptide ABC transporter ATP-binding protein [Spirochaetota bacterium]
MDERNEVLVEIKSLKKYFPLKGGLSLGIKKRAVKAVDDVSFEIKKGETLGLVGESGSGKSTIGRTILRLYEPTEGKIYFEGKEITNLDKESLRKLRPKMQMIFQDSYNSLNPRHNIGYIISEPLIIHTEMSHNDVRSRVQELLELVGLKTRYMNRFPHEFSGGQRQRINIARALALNPDFIVCDEPISALDVSIQAQIVNLLQDLQKKLKHTYLFIAHDLSMVQHISDRIVVIYLGRIMEFADSDELFKNPLHPYTQALISAVPIPSPRIEKKRKRIILKGEIPNPANPPSGCVFHTRCPIAEDVCAVEVPEYRELESNHFVACHFADKSGKSRII